MRATIETVEGTISSAGFGPHRFVIGCWHRSPVGRLVDVMWHDGDRRLLLVSSEEAAAFITSIYRFDDVVVAPLAVTSDGCRTTVDGHGLSIELLGGRRWPIPLRRPRWMTRFIEAPVAKRLLGVETYGTSPTGAREWYQASGLRWVVDGRASLDGRPLGRPQPLREPVGVGFSEPPPKPSIVTLRVAIERPSGQGDRPAAPRRGAGRPTC